MSEQPQKLRLQQAIDLAVRHHTAGRLAQAENICQQILQSDPNHPIVLHLKGMIAHQTERNDVAVDLITKALVIKPDYAEAHSNLGIALRELGKPEEAVASYRKALALKPDYAEARYNLGIALTGLGKLEEAVASYRRAIALKPNYAEAYCNLGVVLKDLGKLDDALASYRKALTLQPNFLEAHSNLGTALRALGKLEEAVASYHKALNLKPDYAEAYCNLGVALKDLGKLDSALTSYRKALTLQPDLAEAHSNLIFTMSYIPEITSADIFEEARRWNTRHGYEGTPPRHQNTPEPERRLRIGLVSGDFRHHSVSYFLETILSEIDREQLEIFAYATSGEEDDLTSRLKSIVPKWRKVKGISDERLAENILTDGIDILVDLSGHTANNRLKMFSRKPAPLQVTWLGYPGTTGVENIDYILCDRLVLPPADEAYFVEKPWRLPGSWFCFTPPAQDIEVRALPALGNGYITFGSFNNLTKISDGTVACWARILLAVPDSHLLLRAAQLKDTAVQEETSARFSAHGIACHQLTLKGPIHDRAEYLRTFNEIDIALDPFPYPGGRTSVESFWMGTPVLTLKGDRFVSHIGESLLQNMGLEAWIADTPEDYVKKTMAFTTDLAALSFLRKSLRNRLLASPICDAIGFARNLEDTFREMWREWCGKKIV